jgi:hypothetical protein
VILKQAPFGVAAILDSVTPPSAELAGESVGVHDYFFGYVNVESLLRFFPQITGFPFGLFPIRDPHSATSPESRHCSIELRFRELLSGASFQPARDRPTLESRSEREDKSERRSIVKSVRRPRAIILDTTDRNGFFDPEKVADLLDWTPEEVRQYLDQQPLSITKRVTVSATHVRLHSLATLIQEVFELMREDIYEMNGFKLRSKRWTVSRLGT